MPPVSPDELAFFPAQCLPLYEAFREALLAVNPDTVFEVRKTQISLKCKLLYGCVSLPRRKADRDAGALLITICLPYHVEDQRILIASEPYPGRWTHHLLLGSAAGLDNQLLGWLREAGSFAAAKRR